MLVFVACSGTVPNEVQQELDRLNAELNRIKKVAKDAINKVNHLEKKLFRTIKKLSNCDQMTRMLTIIWAMRTKR